MVRMKFNCALLALILSVNIHAYAYVYTIYKFLCLICNKQSASNSMPLNNTNMHTKVALRQWRKKNDLISFGCNIFSVYLFNRELPVNINITWMNTLGFSTAWDSFHWKTQNIYPINSCEYFAVLLQRNSLFGECGLYFDSSEMRNFLLTLPLPF